MPQLSLVIIAQNEEQNIATCIESARPLAAEILVIDSGSVDNTVSIAKALGARVVYEPWRGFGAQKRYAVKEARYDWVLCLDADERLTKTLQHAIAAVLANDKPAYQAYQFARCNRFLGRYLRHGEGYPDMSLRLFNRQQAEWSDDEVHEFVHTQQKVGKLAGDLLHDSAESLSQYLMKQNRYTDLQAQILWRKGKKIGCTQLLLSPIIRFIKFYFVRQGFRDGLPGFIHIAIGCINSFLKYIKLIELRVRKQQ
jgi:glycosyltransferase involved in cell wall biosynthesis